MPADRSLRPLDVLVVSYGRPDLLRRCLDGVRRQLPDAQVRVWDNLSAASPEIRRFAAERPEVDWSFGTENLGFAAGVNRLVARGGADTLLLNPDAELTGPLHGSRAALAEPRVAASSPLVVDPNGHMEPWDIAHRRQTVGRILLNHAGYARRLRRTPLSDLYPEPPTEVDGYLTGCCLLISRAAWQDVGPLDERFFLYAEESDWARRALARGWRLRLVAEADVRHGEAEAVHGPPAPRAADMLLANTALAAGPRRASVITAGQLVLSRIQRSKRTARRRAAELLAERSAGPAVILTVDSLDPGPLRRHRVLVANELARRGHPVTVVCTDRLGVLDRQLDPAVRLVLRRWWQPVVDLAAGRAVLIAGATPAELAFGAAWSRLPGGRRRWVRPATGSPGVAGALFGRAAATFDLGGAGAGAGGRRRFAVPPGVDAQPVRELPGDGALTLAVDTGSGPDAAVLAGGSPVEVIGLGAAADRGPVRARPWAARPAETFAGVHALCLAVPTAPAYLAALEAMSCGVAVIAPPTGAFPALLDGGRAGVLLAADTPAAWQRAGAAADRDALVELGARARAHAVAEYTVAASADGFLTMLDELLPE